ncbi:MAG: AMP-binding protein [Candidatus Lokiarchaeota archaeon]|nr:AMP-binding protein [Candidatus Lokiarchaeota archaeon]MBD3201571.1 AMP-binding protein [Candidatus Lokiarchaeota archaeon]
MLTEKIAEYYYKNWPGETPKSINYKEISMGKLLRLSAKTYPDSEAILFEGFRMTYQELDHLVDQFATGLSELGIKKGDVVCIDLPNIPQYIISHFAILRLGAVSNPILPVNRYVEIVHQVNDSKAKCMITLDYLFEEYLEGKDLSKMECLEKIILTGLSEYLPKIKGFLGTILGKIPRMRNWPKQIDHIEFLEFQQILENGQPINIPKEKIDAKKDPAILIYTGGTTGIPKGVTCSHYNLISNAQQTDIWASTQLDRMSKVKGEGGMLLVVPLAHAYGNIGMTVAILEGWSSILIPRPPEKLSKLLNIVKKEDVTFLPGVPTLFVKIIEEPDSKKYKGELGSLIACICSASPLSKSVKNAFEEITHTKILEGYGLSECSPVVSLNPFKRTKLKTVGLPLPDTEVKIVDLVSGNKILPHCLKEDCEKCGESEQKYIGEICVRGPQVMQGYLNRPDATDKAFRKDSNGKEWLYTTDVGCIDRDGYLKLKDRKRDMIKYKGHSVFPREVEDLLYNHKAIAEVGVVGVPDPEAGENIKAYVSLKSDYKDLITEQELLNWCKDNISAYKYPRIIEILPELPKNLLGKVLKKDLRN